MKIAVITDDERTISQHFGRAPYYVVATIEHGQIVDRERRDKLGHAHFSNEPHEHDHQPGCSPGFDAASQDRHTRMAEAIGDCEVLLCGGTLAPALRSGASAGVGAGAYASMQTRGIKPLVTDIRSIDEAIAAYLEGRLVDRVDRLH